ncbi:MAG: FimV family protein [Gammaproteobacteria bacterium]|nr:FimV family protein [Gammaproteobacteria bacterium]
MRKLGLTLVPLVLLRAADVYALGLGDIELRSALNQPLNAEIKLLSATPAELQGLTVALAPEAAFANAGVERLGLLTQIKFNVVQKSDGSHVITVTSNQPVREPFLDFLVEVNWPAGRFVREYTLLLDPAVTENAKDAGNPALIEVPAATKSKPPAASSPATSQGEIPPPPAAELLAKNGDGVGGIAKTSRVSVRQSDGLSYGPTTRTDTLWKIAEEMRPDKSVSTSQVMLALLKHNPHAFSADNVNNLMAGYILRLPSADAVRAISPQQAASEVAAQYQQWLAVQRGEAAPARATAAAGTGAQEGAATSGAQLKLVVPGDAKTSIAGGAKAGSPDTNDLASLRKELALALETAEAGRQENQELRERLTMLEQQIATMQRLMNLKSEDLAAMQNKAAAKAPATAAPATPPAPSTQSSAAAAKPQQVKTPPQPEEPVATDVVGEIMSNPQQLGVIAGGFVLISALLWAMVRRRRAAALEAAENMFSRSAPAPSSPPGEDVSNAAAAVADEEAAASEPAVVSPKSQAHAIHAEEGIIDPIAEADVYLAYKRYEQAESLIKDAMRHDPQRHDLVLKLLEIYHAAKNRDAFETQAETLYAALGGEDHPMWHKVVEMGRQLCPDHPLFAKASSADVAVAGVALAGAVGAGAAMAADVMESGDASLDMQAARAHDVSVELDSDFAAAGDLDSLQASDLDREAHAAPADNLIDFEFGLDKQGTDAVAFDNNEVPASLDNSLDFDLGLTGAIDSLSEAVKNSPVADAPAMAEDAAVFQLDDQTLAGLEDISSAFDAETPPQPETASDDITLASVEPVAEAAPELSYDFAEAKDVAGHGEVIDLSVAGEEAPSLAADNWDLESLASSFDGTAPEQAPAQQGEDDIFAGIDMVGTKLDLAKAYIDMEDKDGARMLLNEVLEEGNATQKQEAQELMAQLA